MYYSVLIYLCIYVPIYFDTLFGYININICTYISYLSTLLNI